MTESILDPITIITAIGVIISLILGIISIFNSNKMSFIQEQYNRLSIQPILLLSYQRSFYEICVYIQNAGLGPLFIENISIVKKSGEKINFPWDFFNQYVLSIIQNDYDKIKFPPELTTDSLTTITTYIEEKRTIPPDLLYPIFDLLSFPKLFSRSQLGSAFAILPGKKEILFQFKPIEKTFIDQKIRLYFLEYLQDLSIIIQYDDMKRENKKEISYNLSSFT